MYINFTEVSDRFDFRPYTQFGLDEEKDGRRCFDFQTMGGCHYRVYQPTLESFPDTDGLTKVATQVDHIRGGGGKDDHCELKVWFTPEGEVNKVTVSFSLADGDYEDAFNTLAGILADAVTVPGIPAIIDVAGWVFGKVANFLGKLSDDGGRVYFPAVVARAAYALAMALVLDGPSEPKYPVLRLGIELDWPKMVGAIGQTFDKAKDDGRSDEKYTYEDHNYRTFYLDGFFNNSNEEGLLLSHKLDHVRGGLKTDDHCALLAYTDTTGKLLMAAALMGIDGEKPAFSGVLKGDNLGPRLREALLGASTFRSHYDSDNDGRQRFPTVVAQNLELYPECIVHR